MYTTQNNIEGNQNIQTPNTNNNQFNQYPGSNINSQSYPYQNTTPQINNINHYPLVPISNINELQDAPPSVNFMNQDNSYKQNLINQDYPQLSSIANDPNENDIRYYTVDDVENNLIENEPLKKIEKDCQCCECLDCCDCCIYCRCYGLAGACELTERGNKICKKLCLVIGFIFFFGSFLFILIQIIITKKSKKI